MDDNKLSGLGRFPATFFLTQCPVTTCRRDRVVYDPQNCRRKVYRKRSSARAARVLDSRNGKATGTLVSATRRTFLDHGVPLGRIGNDAGETNWRGRFVLADRPFRASFSFIL